MRGTEILLLAGCLAVAAAHAVPVAHGPVGYAAPPVYAAEHAGHAEPPQVAYAAYAPAEAHYAAEHVAPVAYAPVAYAAKSLDYDPHPEYKFAYDVQDDLTGDSKSQHESRSGDVVRGSYSLDDPDGTRRTVDYTSDPVHGFNAVVRKEPQAAKFIVPSYAALPAVDYHH